jgi:hypothetical protein
MERACDEYFMNPPPPENQAPKRVNKDALLKLFLKYAEKGLLFADEGGELGSVVFS